MGDSRCVGLVVVNYMREYQLGLGLPREQVTIQTMYILVGHAGGRFDLQPPCQTPDNKWFMTDAELAAEKTGP
jgi:hypothetical protein